MNFPLSIDPKYDIDPDNQMVLRHFDEPPGSRVLEIGANDEHLASVLTDHGYHVLGIDLRPHTLDPSYINYHRIQADFCFLYEIGILAEQDCIISTSALEHFGLGTYPQDKTGDVNYDVIAMRCIYTLLKPGGTCYVTVPYGKHFLQHNNDWRVYNAAALQERFIDKFELVRKEFFVSAECSLGTNMDLLTQEQADEFVGVPPHVTVLAKLRKPIDG